MSTLVTLAAPRRARARTRARRRAGSRAPCTAACRRAAALAGAAGSAPRRLAEVDAAGELADDQQVDALEQLRPERRRRRSSAGWTRDRPQVRVQPEAAAQREQRLLRADRARTGRPTSARRPRRAGSASAAPHGLDVLGPDRHAVGVDRGAAGEDAPTTSTAKPNARAGGVEDAPRGRDDLRPDPVARDRRDPVRRVDAPAPPSRELLGRPRAPTNATSTPLISAPWSLLTATR